MAADCRSHRSTQTCTDNNEGRNNLTRRIAAAGRPQNGTSYRPTDAGANSTPHCDCRPL